MTTQHTPGLDDLLALALDIVAHDDARSEGDNILDLLDAWVTFVDQARAAIAAAKGGHDGRR